MDVLSILCRGFVMASLPDTKDGFEMAKGYIQQHGLSREDVRMFRRDGMIYIETIRALDWPSKDG